LAITWRRPSICLSVCFFFPLLCLTLLQFIDLFFRTSIWLVIKLITKCSSRRSWKNAVSFQGN
jgi:hypothetical protein